MGSMRSAWLLACVCVGALPGSGYAQCMTSGRYFDAYCVTVPADSRLPNPGAQACGLYDIRPERFGPVDNLVTRAPHYGRQQRIYNGFDATLNARLRVQANLDLYNVTNSSSVLNMTTRYGPAWPDAIQIMGGRLAKVSVQLDF